MADEIPTEDVIDIDVRSSNGETMSITLVPAKGDKIRTVKSSSSIEIVKGFETITVYTQNVFHMSVRTRKRPLPVIPFKPASVKSDAPTS